jgi:hypothetical protein
MTPRAPRRRDGFEAETIDCDRCLSCPRGSGLLSAATRCRKQQATNSRVPKQCSSSLHSGQYVCRAPKGPEGRVIDTLASASLGR